MPGVRRKTCEGHDGRISNRVWPGITEEQLESQPGFEHDDRAWGNWMAEREDEPAVHDAIRKLVVCPREDDGFRVQPLGCRLRDQAR